MQLENLSICSTVTNVFWSSYYAFRLAPASCQTYCCLVQNPKG